MHKKNQHNFLNIMLIAGMVLLGASCSPTRKVRSGELFLRKTHISVDNKDMPIEEIKALIRQKPNQKILGFYRLKLQLFNVLNQEKLNKKYENRKKKRADANVKIAQQNEIRRKSGRRKKRAKKEDPSCLSKWLLNIGEPPVIYDSLLAKKSARQMTLYLYNSGYFNAKVLDTTIVNTHKNSVDISYKIKAGKPYRIDSVSLDIEDPNIKTLIENRKGENVIKKGTIFNTSLLDNERVKLTDFLKENGYYAFVKNYILYNADSSLGNHKINLMMEIRRNEIKVPGFLDSTIFVDHIQYKINEVYVNTSFNLRQEPNQTFDTLKFDKLNIISKGAPYFKPKAIQPTIFIKKDSLYSKQNALKTYERISNFHAFRFINIQFKPFNKDSADLLNCEIQLSPMPRQSFTLQAQATNTQGNIGVYGNIIYQNKNLFGGLEIFELKLGAGGEAQRLAGNESENYALKSFLPFNTLMFGPEVSVKFPKLIWPFRKISGNDPKTTISSSYNFQQRPDYQRSIYNLSFGYSWRPGRFSTIYFDPAEINFVNVSLGNSFENLLKSSNNLFLKNSFTSQLITSSKITYSISNQIAGERRNFYYAEFNIENAGLIPAISRSFFNEPEKNSNGKYVILGTPYAQYVRLDVDFRYYHYTASSSSIANRVMIGIGNPYNNSNVMPFVRSFFSGGSNDLRAWQARTLGPGSFKDSLGIRFDRIGDIKIALNIEFRQKIYKMFESALFMDAGNIWLRKSDPSFPNGDFSIHRFYKEIALGAGLGLRLNFDYFIIRLDAAHPLYDPSYLEGNRWCLDKLDLKNINFNLGIAYPF